MGQQQKPPSAQPIAKTEQLTTGGQLLALASSEIVCIRLLSDWPHHVQRLNAHLSHHDL